jgi:cytochrome c-type biogenesis protein
MDITLIISAFIAGILTFLAPCTFPLAPAYLGFISGVPRELFIQEDNSKQIRRKIFLNGLFYVLGFSFIFVLFGVLFGFIGSFLSVYKIWFARIGGIFVIFFGLYMLHLFDLPFLNKEKHLFLINKIKPGKPLSSFIFGVTFALSWTPCIGPILGTIFILASTTGTILQGTFLLLVFAFGLAVPYLLIAWFVGSASVYIKKVSKYLNVISIVGGVFLIVLGILLITNSFGLWISTFYKLFNFINYDELLNYL